jgi:hypothetical protein
MLVAAGGLLVARHGGAQPLSPAQLALFETPHLLALQRPTRLDYDFLREEEGRDPVSDRIRLEVRPGEDAARRDVTVEFLTGPRNLPYPPARGFRGNPLLLFALDRDVRELAAATGGAMHWFRERIRRAFAEGAERQEVVAEVAGGRHPATEFSIRPFEGEPRARRFRARRYGFVVAEAIPGAVAAIRSETPGGEGGGAVTESIVFRSATPLPEEARP